MKLKQKQTLALEIIVFWDKIADNLPKSIERSALGDEKIFTAFAVTYPQIKEYLHQATVEEIIKIAEGNKRNYPMVDEPEWRRGYVEALTDLIEAIKK
jgi:hypothetical protein